MQVQVFKSAPKKIDRSPRLDSILMVEKALFRYGNDKTVAQIWRLLPKKMMWSTFTTILEYLEYSGKIHVEKDRTVTWLWNPSKVKEMHERGLVVD